MVPDGDTWPDQAWFDQWQPHDISFTPPASPRLGVRFEALIAAWIDSEPRLELLARNLPVRTADLRRTIGEFDFIVACTDAHGRRQIEHWEVAVKFYLGTGDGQDMARWFGPDPRDTLAAKNGRMKAHQLRLADRAEAVDLLESRGLQVQRRRALVKGRLFLPAGDTGEQGFAVPDGVNPAHERGWWQAPAAFASDPAQAARRFLPLDKPRWLAPVSGVPDDLLLDHAGVQSLAAWGRRTLHLAVVDSDGREVSRGFVVSNHWLQSVSP